MKFVFGLIAAAALTSGAAFAQGQPAAPSSSGSAPWHWLYEPLAGFSRGEAPAAAPVPAPATVQRGAATASASPSRPAPPMIFMPPRSGSQRVMQSGTVWVPQTGSIRPVSGSQAVANDSGQAGAVPPPPAPPAETSNGTPGTQLPSYRYVANRVPPALAPPAELPAVITPATPTGPNLTGPAETPAWASPTLPTPALAVPALAGQPSANPNPQPQWREVEEPGRGPMSAMPIESRLRMSASPIIADPALVQRDVEPIKASWVFRTRDVVRPDLLKGKDYRLVEYAPLIDYRFRFEIETPWGTIPAHGMGMLELRLRELQSIEYATRIASKNPMFVEGLVQAAAKTPEGAYLLVTDPLNSVRRAATGLKRIAEARTSPGGRRANCESRRRLACLLSCDPETNNIVLACLLDDMSTNVCAGWLTADVALNFGVPGLGVLPANAEFKRMMAMRSTKEILCDLDASLTELGIPEPMRVKFVSSTAYTTTQRMAFVYYLRKLIGIENLSSLVEGANDTANESEALASIQELQMLVDLRRTQAIKRVTFVGLPLIVLADGRQMILTASDYIVESPRIEQMVSRYRSDYPLAATTFVTIGRVSTGAARQFDAAGIRVAQHRFGIEDPEAKSSSAAQHAANPETKRPAVAASAEASAAVESH